MQVIPEPIEGGICPRCYSTLAKDTDQYGSWFVCLTCGYEYQANAGNTKDIERRVQASKFADMICDKCGKHYKYRLYYERHTKECKGE